MVTYVGTEYKYIIAFIFLTNDSKLRGYMYVRMVQTRTQKKKTIDFFLCEYSVE